MSQYNIFNLALDPVINFGKVTVSTGYTSAALSIVLNPGEGAKLPDPSISGWYNLVWYNSTDYPDPSDDPLVEIVRVTSNIIITNTLGILRGQEGTLASNKNLSTKTYKMILSPTKKTVDDIQTDAQSRVNTHAYLTSTHGVLGNILGTTDIQTLTNKIISGDNNTLQNINFETAIKQSTFQNQSFQNLLKNGNFEFWSAGPTSSPDLWGFADNGAGASIARESTIVKYGIYSTKLISGNVSTYSPQIITNNYFKGRTVTFGSWVSCNVANKAFIQITDGVGGAASSYHSGSGNWEFLTVTLTISASASENTFRSYLYVLTNGGANVTAYFDGAILVEGSIVPAFMPHPFDTVLAEPRLKVSSFAHDVSTTGPQSITGIGFKPGSLALLGVIPNSHAVTMAISDFSNTGGIYNNTAETPGWDTTGVLRFKTGSGTSATFTLNTTPDPDGFTGTWAKFGSPTGIAYIYYLASR